MNEHTETQNYQTPVASTGISLHDFICELAALGLKTQVIADRVGAPEEYVKSILADEKMQFAIKHLKHNYFKHDPKKRFELLAARAIDVKEEMLGPEKKDSVRNKAANDILDRHLGKPEQTINHESGSLLRALLEKINARSLPPAPSDPVDAAKPVGGIIDVAPVQPEPAKAGGNVSDWVNKNL